MKKIKLRTKSEAVIAVSFLILISVSSVYSVTRTISGTEDTIYTYIRNSNGKYWEATDDNIQLAIWDLNDTDGGTVWLPAGTIDCDRMIEIHEPGIRLQGVGSATHWGALSGGTKLHIIANLPSLINVSNDGDHCTAFQMMDIKIYGSDRTHTTHAVWIEDSSGVVITRCGFHDINGSALYFNDSCYAPTITKCHFQGCGGHAEINPSGTILFDEDCTSAFIENCVFEVDWTYSIQDTVNYHGVSGGHINNNFFETTYTSAYPCTTLAHIHGYWTYGTITDNYFYNINKTHAWANDQTAINLSGGYGYTGVRGNLIYNYGIGIKIDNYVPYGEPDYCIVTDNIIRDTNHTIIEEGAVFNSVTNNMGRFTTDTNLQDAIDGSDNNVYLPQGTITITKQINIAENDITIHGMGSGTILKLEDNHDANIDMLYITGHNVTLENLLIDGNKGGQSSGDVWCIDTDSNADELKLRDVTLIDASAGGIYTNGDRTDIDNCWFYRANITIDDDFTSISNCFMTGSKVAIDGSSQESKISNCHIRHSPSDGIECDGDRCVLEGNIIISSAHYGIEIKSNAREITIDGNEIGSSGAYGISSTGNGEITDNYIHDSITYGILATSGMVISGNTVEDSGSYGIRFTSNCVVSNNIVRNSVLSGIYPYTAENSTIIGNRCYDNQGTKTQDYGIYIQSGCKNLTITENNVNGNVNAVGIFLDGSDHIIKDNIGYNYNSLFPFYDQATPPTMLENTTAYWYNTTGGWLYQVANSYGTQYYLNMSTTY